jgi:hypothetical protein
MIPVYMEFSGGNVRMNASERFLTVILLDTGCSDVIMMQYSLIVGILTKCLFRVKACNMTIIIYQISEGCMLI